MQKMLEKFGKYMKEACHILEMLAAILVLVGIVMSMLSLLRSTELFGNLLKDTDAFMHYLEQIFTIVIGIEFLQMLCSPNSDNVIETLIFLVARHMVVGSTNPYEDFVSVISIALLCVLRRYLSVTKGGRERLFGIIKEKKIRSEEDAKKREA